MFQILNQIREAWNEARFILLYDSSREELCMVIPSQIIRSDHIAEMRINAGGLICTTVDHEFCRSVELPLISTIYDGISARYPLIRSMHNSGSNFSVSVDHIDCISGISDKDRALTISSIGDIVDDFDTRPIKSVNLIRKFGNTFRIPGHVPLLRAMHGLLRRKISQTELSLALCDISSQAHSTTICQMMDKRTGNVLNLDDGKKFAIEKNYPIVEKKTIINLWRSIKKIDKSDFLVDISK